MAAQVAPSDPLGPILGSPGGSKHYKNQWFFNVFAFRIFGLPGILWSPLGPSWRPLGALLAPLGTHLGAQGLSLGPLGGPLAPLGQLLGRPKPLLDSSWGYVGGAVCPIEPPWCHHDPFWELPDSIWGPFWTRFGAFQVQISYILSWPDAREASNSQTHAGTKLEIRATGEESRRSNLSTVR